MQTPEKRFSRHQWNELNEFLNDLDDHQTLWLNDYLAVSVRSTLAPENTSTTVSGSALIAYVREIDNCRGLAERLAQQCRAAGIVSEISDLAIVRPRKLIKQDYLIVITATHDDGVTPKSISDFYGHLLANDAPSVQGVKFAVLALGDSSYEQLCVTGVTFDH